MIKIQTDISENQSQLQHLKIYQFVLCRDYTVSSWSDIEVYYCKRKDIKRKKSIVEKN